MAASAGVAVSTGAAGAAAVGTAGTDGRAEGCAANGAAAVGAGGVAGVAASGSDGVTAVELGDGIGGCAACGAAAGVAGDVGDAASATDGAAGVEAGGAGTGVAFGAAGAAAVDDGAVGPADMFVPGGAGPSGKRSEYPRLPTSNRPIDRAANRPITHPVFILTAPSLLPPCISPSITRHARAQQHVAHGGCGPGAAAHGADAAAAIQARLKVRM
jgi:hypothetical protein